VSALQEKFGNNEQRQLVDTHLRRSNCLAVKFGEGEGKVLSSKDKNLGVSQRR
jgi:hypothetical protein